MKLLILLFLSLESYAETKESHKTDTVSPTIFSVTDDTGYIYYITLDRVRPGYSAGLVQHGILAGKVAKDKNYPVTTVPENITNLFAFQIEKDEKNSAIVKKAKEEFFKKILDKPVLASPVAQLQQPKTVSSVTDWTLFEACARQNLPYLREAIALKYKMSQDSGAETAYYLAKSIIDESTTQQGFVCGAFLREDLAIRISDEMRNVKILTTLLKRAGNDRQELLRTLVGAFSEKAPGESKLLYTYYFARQYFVGGLSDKPLPTYEELNSDLNLHPKVQELAFQYENEVILHQTTLKIYDSEILMLQGREFFKKEKL